MNALPLTVRALECLCALSLLVQSLEFLKLQPVQCPDGLWRWQRQQSDVAHASAFTRRLLDWLYGARVHHIHLLLRTGAAASLFAGSSTISVSLLFVSTLLILIRWRGAFNGGSDFMTVVVLSGMMIGQWGQYLLGPALAWKAGLIYIALHAMSSYFISGAIKLFSREWRNGVALPYFLDGGLYGPLAPDSIFRRRAVAVGCSWAFILWECAVPLALLGPWHAVTFCAVAVIFHLLVFRFFGLNRFVWAWLASHPAIIYCATLL